MDSNLKTICIIITLSFIKTHENNLSCITNEVNDIKNITEIVISKIEYKFLNQILKKHENESIDLILSWLDLKNLEDLKINNSYLNKIDFSNNCIEEIPQYIFNRLKFIKEINLYQNLISDLTNFYREIDKNPCAFLYLETLNLRWNKISSLIGNNFNKLKNLKVLSLDNNKIKILSNFDINKFNQVKELLLGNQEMIISEDISFRNFSNLESLDLKNSQFKSLNSNIFSGLMNLSNLELDGINLCCVTENIFLQLKNLKNLSISRIVENQNQFLDIFSYFSNRDRLEHLDISGNNLISLEDFNFNQFSNLKTLISSGNNIRHPTSFYGMNELRNINLGSNNIESMNFNLFFKENKIEEFLFYNNKIKKIDFDFFKEAKRLTYLDLSSNDLIDLSQICFSCMTNLKEIYLQNNNISLIPSFEKNVNLEYIALYSNNIQIIQSNLFCNLFKLYSIEFDDNPIKLIEPFAFYNCTNLRSIRLPINNLGIDSLYNLLKTLNIFVVDNTIDVKYFNTIHVINSDEIDQRFCILMIYFLRHRVRFIPSELFYHIPYHYNEDSIIYNKKAFYYTEELTIQFFMSNCSNLNIIQSEKFDILETVNFSGQR